MKGIASALEIEELSLSAWPALQTELFDGWALRFAEGYTKRSNSVNALYAGAIELEAKIGECERAYEARGLPTVFKILDLEAHRTLDEALSARGYARLDETAVRVLDLASLEFGTEPDGTVLGSGFDEKWIEAFCSCSGNGRNIGPIRKILENVLCEKIVASKILDGRVVGCGYGAVQRGWGGVFDIVVDPAFRGRGYGRQIVSAILGAARRLGAGRSYLQVVSGNAVAESLYSSLGFLEAYRYWYRKKL